MVLVVVYSLNSTILSFDVPLLCRRPHRANAWLYGYAAHHHPLQLPLLLNRAPAASYPS